MIEKYEMPGRHFFGEVVIQRYLQGLSTFEAIMCPKAPIKTAKRENVLLAPLASSWKLKSRGFPKNWGAGGYILVDTHTFHLSLQISCFPWPYQSLSLSDLRICNALSATSQGVGTADGGGFPGEEAV